MPSPAVSVIIAAFNAQYHIERAVASALAQTGVAVEVIIGDDASTDATCAVVQAIDDPRVRLVRVEQNGGPSAARNAAIAAAKAPWLAVLDADDRMQASRLSDLLALAEQTGADLVADNMSVDGPDGVSLFIDEPLDGGFDVLEPADYIQNNRVFHAGKGYGYLKPMFRAQFLRDHGITYDPALRIGEDFAIVIEMMARGARYVRGRSAGYVYTVAAGSISHRLNAKNATAMAEADSRFLARFGGQLPADFIAAMKDHQRSVEEAAAFARIVDAIKSRAWGDVLREGAQRPAALRHLTRPIAARLGLKQFA